MNSAGRAALLARYRAGYDEVMAALKEVGDHRLDTPGDAGEGWTPRQVVHHLADSEMTSAIRLRRLLAEESPVIHGYDEAAFARTLFYDRRPVEPSLAAFRAARESSAAILDCLDEPQWARSGTHTESGPYSVEIWLELYAEHAHDHANQIRTAAASR